LRDVQGEDHFDAAVLFSRGISCAILWPRQNDNATDDSQQQQCEFEESALGRNTFTQSSKQRQVAPLLFASTGMPCAVGVQEEECRNNQQQIEVFWMDKFEHDITGFGATK
jgi:hypothetical protein